MMKELIVISILVLASCGEQTAKSNEADSPSTSNFVWNFSKQRNFVYSFSQTTNVENKMGNDITSTKTSMTVFGHLNVRVKDSSLADLSLTDLEMKMIMMNDNETIGDTITQETPAIVVQDMKPDGSFGDSNTDILFDLLFPLPKNNCQEGESAEIPMQMPFNANGSRLFAKGHNTLTFTSYDVIDGKKCAVLIGEIDISDLDVPKELKGEYKCSSTGNATYFFDLENGYYVGSDIHVVMEVLMDAETENEDGFGMYMEMKSENVYKIRLEKIED